MYACHRHDTFVKYRLYYLYKSSDADSHLTTENANFRISLSWYCNVFILH